MRVRSRRSRSDEDKDLGLRIVALLPIIFFSLLAAFGHGQEKHLEPVSVSYPSVTGNMAPLWIAREKRLFEKYGLEPRLVNIASGVISVNALISGEIQLAAASSSSAVTAAAQGAPVVIIATFGPTPYKLVAHPSITSIDGLRGKIIGSSRPGAGSDYALRRLLPKLGLVSGRDVTILPTGLSESDKRILTVLQGKIDATIGTLDSISQFELRGQKLSVLADLLAMGVYTSGSVLATTRQYLKEHRSQAKAFLGAFCEAIWMGRTDKELAFQIYRKNLRVQDPGLLEVIYKTSLLDRIPLKPYPQEEAIQFDLDSMSTSSPEFAGKLKGKKPSDFIDASILKELEREDFFTRLQR
jgi:ABC-type nitrate/sulfonate/bicarbonate transport system substrate-binding protein